MDHRSTKDRYYIISLGTGSMYDLSFLHQYRIHMDIGNSKNYLGIYI